MPGDIDVVRCALPWPGIAAHLLEAFAALGSGSWTLERLSTISAIGLAPGDAAQVLSGLAMAGVCKRSDDGSTWSTDLNFAETARLATLLRGAEHYRRLRVESPNLELAVTMPMAPSRLELQLPAIPGRPGGYLPTPSAFQRVAAAAKSRLVIMTPFINGWGFEWLQAILLAANESAEKILILRDIGKYAAELSVHHAEWLRGLRVSVRDYNISHPVDNGRLLPMETFHAKIALADDCLAYVGSANMLGSGDGTSLEAGFLVDGLAAVQVSRLVDGVLRVARSM